MISNSKLELEEEHKAYVQNLSEEICNLTLDNAVLVKQIETLKAEIKEMAASAKAFTENNTSCNDLRDITNISVPIIRPKKSFNPGRLSRKWLKSIVIAQPQTTDMQGFNGFMDLVQKNNQDHFQVTKNFDHFHNKHTSHQKYQLNPRNNYLLPPEDFEEVSKVLDSLLFIVEVEYDIESRVALDLSFVTIDRHLEAKLSKKVSKYNSPTRNSSIQSYRNIATPRKMTRLAEVPSTEIFAVNYHTRLQKFAQISAYNSLQSYISYGAKTFEGAFDKEEGIEGNEKQLVLEMSEMLLNSYNYSQFLTNQR